MNRVKAQLLDRIWHIRLSRPEKHNAFDAAMIDEITAAFHQVNQQPTARAVFLSAEGKSFCAGADLDYMRSMAKYSEAENLRDSERLFDMFASVQTCALPTVVLAKGHVMGGGLGLLAACDVAVAVAGSQFCFSEVRIGLVPAVISPFVREKVGRGWANNWMLSGRRFDCAEALASGLIQFSGDEQQTQSHIEEVLTLFRTNGPTAVKQTKRLLSQLAQVTSSEWKATTTPVIAKQRVSAEGQEGLSAFFEKRDPSWKGQA